MRPYLLKIPVILLFTTLLGSESMAQDSIIFDHVWVDENSNGIHDSGEGPIVDATVKLYIDHNGDGYPERLAETTQTDANGEYLFQNLAANKYSVSVDLGSLPEANYLMTSWNTGPDEAADSDTDPHTLRSDVIDVSGEATTYEHLGSIGFLSGSTNVVYHGEQIYGNFAGETYPHDCWTYQDIIFYAIPRQGVTTEMVTRWIKWYKRHDQFYQELQNRSDYLTRARANWVHPATGEREPFRILAMTSNSCGAGCGNGSKAEALGIIDDAVGAPEDPLQHWILFYEMGRGGNATSLWDDRAVWPHGTVILPHMMGSLAMYELGGLDGFQADHQGGFTYSTYQDELDQWASLGLDFVELFGGMSSGDDAVFHTVNGTTYKLRPRNLALNIMNKVMIEFGREKMVEALSNMARAEVMGNNFHAAATFKQAIDDALDGAYQSLFESTWGFPTDAEIAATIDRSSSTGPFVDQDEYRWDVQHFAETRPVEPGFEKFTDLHTEGILRWTQTPDNYSVRIVASTIGGDVDTDYAQSFVGGRGRFGLSHQLANGTWQVMIDVPGIYSGESDYSISLESGQLSSSFSVQHGAVYRFSGLVEVDDGVLDIDFNGSSRAMAIAGLIIKRSELSLDSGTLVPDLTNTEAVDGTDPWYGGYGESPKWRQRVVDGFTFYSADEASNGGANDDLLLVTTLSGLDPASSYRIGFNYGAKGNWCIKAGLDPAALQGYASRDFIFGGDNYIGPSNPQVSVSAQALGDVPIYHAALGLVAPEADGTIKVYVDDPNNAGISGDWSRAWYFGLTYEEVAPVANAGFALEPTLASTTSIQMTANLSDAINGGVEYYFREVSGQHGGTDSGWLQSPRYTDHGLMAGTTYAYTLEVRDRLGVTSDPTPDFTATTPAGSQDGFVELDLINTASTTGQTVWFEEEGPWARGPEWKERFTPEGIRFFTADEAYHPPDNNYYTLVTTLYGLVPNSSYKVELEFSSQQSWAVLGGLDADNLQGYSNRDFSYGGDTFVGKEHPSVENTGRTLFDSVPIYRANLGTTRADMNGEIKVYIDDPTNENTTSFRSWVLGVAYTRSATSYQEWAQQNGGAALADGDGNTNGIPDGIEFFMGATSTAPKQFPTTFAYDRANLSLRVPFDFNADIEWRFQVSENLKDWSDLVEGDPAIRLHPQHGEVELLLPDTFGSGRAMVRLLVVE